LAEYLFSVPGERLEMGNIASRSADILHVQAIQNAPAAAKAATYLRGLDQYNVQARDNHLPENQYLFFRRLRFEMEAALKHFEKSVAGWSESVEDFESYTELDWLCNQCEYWMGPADNMDLSRIHQKWADMKYRTTGMTSREYTAVRLLVRIANTLTQIKRNPLFMIPRPMNIYRGAMNILQDQVSENLYVLHRAKRYFVLRLKAFFLLFG
jgi:hypothetical protein